MSDNGWLCLDKPSGLSSNAAMSRVKRIFGQKTGYIGTLDPFATGVLPIAVGNEACKFIPYVSNHEKEYQFVISFGKETDTLDIDGKVIKISEKIPSYSEISEVLPLFLGESMQIPPLFSAIKISGKRACDRVRSGENVILSPRKINIKSISILKFEANETEISVICSKGTYIRSLARDIAEKLETIAYVKSLRRIKSGFFSINNAIPLEKISQIKDTNMLFSVLTPIESPLDDIPALYVEDSEAIRLQNGLQIKCNCEFKHRNMRIFSSVAKKFIGIAIVTDNYTLKPVRMRSLIMEINDVDKK